MRGLFKTKSEYIARKVLTVLYHRLKVGFDFKDGWYLIVTEQKIDDLRATELSFLARMVETTDIKSYPISYFKQIDSSDSSLYVSKGNA